MAMWTATYDVGIYVRLSRDDKGYGTVSLSIENQIKILKDYVQGQGWNLREVYKDDGFTGTNFNRPDFQRMIRDVKDGKINCIITKDLSRLGRNYVECGYYTEEFFPTHDVRYLALNDGIDTLSNTDMMAFHHVVNEFYPKEISKKVRQVKDRNAKEGKFIGVRPPYGLTRDPKNNLRFVFDPEPPAASIVRRIFAELYVGESARAIGERLTSEGVDSPYYFLCKKQGKTPKSTIKNAWGSATVLGLARNEAFIGNMVQGKRKNVSFKLKKRRMVDKKDWIVIENTHDALIDRETWDVVQRRLDSKHVAHRSKSGVIGLFAGVARCGDCGGALSYMRRTLKSGDFGVYRCSLYNNSGNSACTSHYIREDTLAQIVLNDIRKHAQLAQADAEALANQLMKSAERCRSGTARELDRRLKEIQTRLDAIGTLTKSLYEDKVSGIVPLDVFNGLLAGYKVEREDLEAKHATLFEQRDTTEGAEREVSEWIKRVSQYVDATELDRDMLAVLVESIVVLESDENGRALDITIKYRFVSDYLQNAKEDIA